MMTGITEGDLGILAAAAAVVAAEGDGMIVSPTISFL